MASEKSFELKVGVFVGIGIVIFFIIVFSIGDISLVKEGYRILTTFSFVDGVTESSPVRYAGVDIGHVERIGIYYDEGAKKNKVRLTVWINDKERKIEKDAVAIINTLGLLGEKYLEIFPGDITSGALRDGDVLKGQDPVVMRDVTNTLNKLAASADAVLTRLKEGKGTIGKLLVDESIYDNLDEFVADIKAHPWKLLHKPKRKEEQAKDKGKSFK